jgi:hypothetical protein
MEEFYIRAGKRAAKEREGGIKQIVCEGRSKTRSMVLMGNLKHDRARMNSDGRKAMDLLSD